MFKLLNMFGLKFGRPFGYNWFRNALLNKGF